MTKRNINHVEIPARDPEQAGEFYHELFGWKITPIPQANNYTVWESDEGSRGGLTPLEADNQPGDILIYINSDDIEADLKKARSLGAQVLQERTKIPGRGWYGVFKDPTGNRIGLFTRRQNP